jgi:hypothetical protein
VWKMLVVKSCQTYSNSVIEKYTPLLWGYENIGIYLLSQQSKTPSWVIILYQPKQPPTNKSYYVSDFFSSSLESSSLYWFNIYHQAS